MATKTLKHSLKVGQVLRSVHGYMSQETSRYEVIRLVGVASVEVQNVKGGRPFTARVFKAPIHEGIKISYGEFAFTN